MYWYKYDTFKATPWMLFLFISWFVHNSIFIWHICLKLQRKQSLLPDSAIILHKLLSWPLHWRTRFNDGMRGHGCGLCRHTESCHIEGRQAGMHKQTKRIYCSETEMAQAVQILPCGWLVKLCIQCHDCWYHCDSMSQPIIKHGGDLIIQI